MQQAEQTTSLAKATPSAFRVFLQGKTRIVSAWVFAILLGYFSREFPQWPGLVVCFFGATLRFWSSGYLRKDSRPAVGGPYSFVRNPLYLGTYIMAVGICLAVEAWWLCGVTTVLFAAVHHFIILDEEVKLARIFGEPYNLYCRLVPRFFPRLFPPCFPARTQDLLGVNPERTHLKYDWALGWKRNKSYESYVTFLGFWAFAAICAWMWQR